MWTALMASFDNSTKAWAGSGASFFGGELANVIIYQLGIIDGTVIPAGVVQSITNLCIAAMVFLAVWMPNNKKTTRLPDAPK